MSHQASSLTDTFRVMLLAFVEEVHTVFLAAVKHLKMLGCWTFSQVQMGGKSVLFCNVYKCVLKCVQASDPGKGDIWLRNMSHTAGKKNWPAGGAWQGLEDESTAFKLGSFTCRLKTDNIYQNYIFLQIRICVQFYPSWHTMALFCSNSCL